MKAWLGFLKKRNGNTSTALSLALAAAALLAPIITKHRTFRFHRAKKLLDRTKQTFQDSWEQS
jgi:hypothetical protein